MYTEHNPALAADFVQQLLACAKTLDIAPGPGGSRITDVEATLRAFSAVPDLIGEPIKRLMVVALYPSSQLVGHKDDPIQGKRFHIPLQMNDGCWVHHDGQWAQLQIGHIYEMNPTEFHGAVNWGHDIRLHLVIDV